MATASPALPSLKREWEAIRAFKVTDDPAVAEAKATLDKACAAYRLAATASNVAKRSRSKDKAQRIADAQTILDVTDAAMDAAQTAYNEATKEPDYAQYAAIRALHIGFAVALFGDTLAVRFLNAHPTGEMVKPRYGGDEYEAKTYTLDDQPGDDCLAVELGLIRISPRVPNRDGELAYEVEALDPDKRLRGGQAAEARFGYHADVRWEVAYDGSGWKPVVRWGSYSGMETLEDCQTTISVHQMAVNLAALIERTLR